MREGKENLPVRTVPGAAVPCQSKTYFRRSVCVCGGVLGNFVCLFACGFFGGMGLRGGCQLTYEECYKINRLLNAKYVTNQLLKDLSMELTQTAVFRRFLVCISFFNQLVSFVPDFS